VETVPAATRLPRYRRHRHRKPAFALQERDRQIIRLVAGHRVIASEDIQLLVAGSNQVILRRLQKLFHAGYLDRPRSQRQRPNGPMVYALGPNGAALHAAESGQRCADWSEKNRQLGFLHLEHALMVSRFQTALQFTLRTNANAVLERWLPDGVVRDHVIVERENGAERVPIAPDAFFTIKLVNEPDGRNRVHVFLEADRGTMTAARFLRKLEGYWHWWRSGRPERYGIRNFQVATVTRTKERAASLCEVAKEVDAPQNRGLRMFLFATEADYLPANRASVLESIWRTPAGEGGQSLLE
jgi:hypothetical protein